MEDLEIRIVHTGQHFDDRMSKIFFTQFDLEPDKIITLSSSTANSQIAEIMIRLEETFIEDRPDCIMVAGDVNSTLAGALVANKMGIKLAHLESGLRSNDRTMPEEINRILTDQLADILFVTENSGIDNLVKESKALHQIHFVGNTMIDTMLAFDDKIESSNILNLLKIKTREFVLMTMHRPATVDNKEGLIKLFQLLSILSKNRKVIFPIHPRTLKNIARFGLQDELNSINNLILSEPLDYFSFQKLIKECCYVLTDSGGIQEEASQRGVPCLTLRPNTERPVTISSGTNTLIPFEIDSVLKYVNMIESGLYKVGSIPPNWDGKATERVLEIIRLFI